MAQTTPSAASGRLVSIDILRALAALAVVLHHVPVDASNLSQPLQTIVTAPGFLGRLGVPIFFVISGFCIHASVARSLARGAGAHADWLSFWRRRFWRLYPPYLFAMPLGIIVYYWIGSEQYARYERIPSLPWDIAYHLLMIQNLMADFAFSLGNGPFWTLAVEEQLYALYALLLVLRRQLSVRTLVLLTLGVSLAWQGTWRYLGGMDNASGAPDWGKPPLALGNWLAWPLGLWVSWVLGAWAAEGHWGVTKLPGWCYRRRVALAFLLLGLATTHRVLEPAAHRWPAMDALLRVLSALPDLSFGAAAFVLVNRWVRAELSGAFRGWFAQRMAHLGVMSYSLYLTHMPIVKLICHWLPDGPGVGLWLLRLAVVFPVALLWAVLFFWSVERHFLITKRQISRDSSARTARA